MASWSFARSGACRLVVLLFISSGLFLTVLAEEEEETAIPDKVGAEVHLSKQERTVLKKVECSMCKAILREMHLEVVKHKMTSGGWGSESQVWETSNAMCLGMLQKYKLDLANSKIEKKEEDEDEQMGMGGGDPAATMRGMLVLKMGCQRWLEDFGGDTSGFVYKRVVEDTSTAEATAKDFCKNQVLQCGKTEKKKLQEEKKKDKTRQATRQELSKKEDKEEAKRMEDDPFSKLPKDSMAGLQRMLEMAKDDPLHYMDDAAKLRIQQAQKDLRCDVCREALNQVADEVSKRPKSMRAEYDILPFAEGACEGGKDTSVPSYFGVDPPPLAPLWTDSVRPKLDKKTNRYRLKKFPKKAAKKRKAWRKLTKEGTQKPPPQDEHEGDMMMTMSCKDILEPARMSELVFQAFSGCDEAKIKQGKCHAGMATARQICKDVDDKLCEYADDEPANEKAKKEEL